MDADADRAARCERLRGERANHLGNVRGWQKQIQRGGRRVSPEGTERLQQLIREAMAEVDRLGRELEQVEGGQ